MLRLPLAPSCGVVVVADRYWADKLVAWAETVWQDAGVTPTKSQLLDMATAAGRLVFTHGFLPEAEKVGMVDSFVGRLDPARMGFNPPDSELFLDSYDGLHAMFVDVVCPYADNTGIGWEKGNRAEIIFDGTLMGLKHTWTEDIRRDHGGPRAPRHSAESIDVSCPVCGKVFRTRTQMEGHLRTRH